MEKLEKVEYRDDMSDEEKEELRLKMIRNLNRMIEIIEQQEYIDRSYT